MRHPQDGSGTVKAISETVADILFDEGSKRAVAGAGRARELLDPQAAVVAAWRCRWNSSWRRRWAWSSRNWAWKSPTRWWNIGLRWHHGKMVLHRADAALQAKEVPLEVFFHKLIGVRDQLRCSSVAMLRGADRRRKVEMQKDISRCYGSLTTFNILFKNKEDQFRGESFLAMAVWDGIWLRMRQEKGFFTSSIFSELDMSISYQELTPKALN